MRATLISKIHEVSDIYSFIFQPEEQLDYIAGQFIELGIKLETTSNDLPKRWFTLSSSPTEEHLIVTTRIGNNSTDFKRKLLQLHAGDKVLISQAMGDFVLPTNPAIPLIFFAAGIGITPFRSMIKWLIDTDEQRNIQFLQVIRDDDSKVFESVFLGYNFEYNQIISSKVAHIDDVVQKIVECTQNKDALIYSAGPELMVESLKNSLLLNNYSENRIVTDFFPGYTKI